MKKFTVELGTGGVATGATEQVLAGIRSNSASKPAYFFTNITSELDGSVIFTVATDDNSDQALVQRHELDANTGLYYVTHSSVVPNNFYTGTAKGGLCIAGNFLYLAFDDSISGKLNVTRFAKADLTSPTVMTVSGTPTITGAGIFSNGTQIFIRLTAGSGTFTRYTISGTNLNTPTAITGGKSNAIGAYYEDGVVYMSGSNSTVTNYTISGSTFVAGSTKTYEFNLNQSTNAGGNGICGMGHRDSGTLFYGFNQSIADSPSGGGSLYSTYLTLKALSKPL